MTINEGLLKIVLVVFLQKLISFVCKNINLEVIIWIGPLGCFGKGLTFGPLKLVLAMKLRIRD